MNIRQHVRADGSPKIGYGSRAAAEAVREWHQNAAWLGVYKCGVCGRWHLGRTGRIVEERDARALREELGDRAVSHLLAENSRGELGRLAAMRGRLLSHLRVEELRRRLRDAVPVSEAASVHARPAPADRSSVG